MMLLEICRASETIDAAKDESVVAAAVPECFTASAFGCIYMIWQFEMLLTISRRM